jgi:hypothetical protein
MSHRSYAAIQPRKLALALLAGAVFASARHSWQSAQPPMPAAPKGQSVPGLATARTTIPVSTLATSVRPQTAVDWQPDDPGQE